MGGSPLWSATIRRRSQHRLGGLPVYLDAWHVAPAVVPYPCHPCDQWFNRNSSTTDFTHDADATSRSAGSNYPGERRFIVALNIGWVGRQHVPMGGTRSLKPERLTQPMPVVLTTGFQSESPVKAQR
jgi:hypothetical protein